MSVEDLTRGSDSRPQNGLTMLAGNGITGFLYQVGVLAALDEMAGRVVSNDFDLYVGTSAGGVRAVEQMDRRA